MTLTITIHRFCCSALPESLFQSALRLHHFDLLSSYSYYYFFSTISSRATTLLSAACTGTELSPLLLSIYLGATKSIYLSPFLPSFSLELPSLLVQALQLGLIKLSPVRSLFCLLDSTIFTLHLSDSSLVSYMLYAVIIITIL